MNILVADDDETTCSVLRFVLEQAGFSVSVVSSPISAIKLLERKEYHLVLMEVIFDGSDSGLEFCQTIQEDGYDIPVFFVTRKSSVIDRVAGLRAGADDFMCKPFDPGELVERVKCIFRRYHHALAKRPLSTGRLKLDADELTVTTAVGKGVALTPTEMRLLRHLMMNAGRTVPRESLVSSIWGFASEGEGNSVDVYVRRLRKKIETDPSRPEILQTVRGAGYRLVF